MSCYKHEQNNSNKNKRKEKMNWKNEMNILVFSLQQFQQVIGNYYNSYTLQFFENMMGQSYMTTHLLQNAQNTQLYKQDNENSDGSSSSSKNK